MLPQFFFGTSVSSHSECSQRPEKVSGIFKGTWTSLWMRSFVIEMGKEWRLVKLIHIERSRWSDVGMLRSLFPNITGENLKIFLHEYFLCVSTIWRISKHSYSTIWQFSLPPPVRFPKGRVSRQVLLGDFS